jgi:hypothetical protein
MQAIARGLDRCYCPVHSNGLGATIECFAVFSQTSFSGEQLSSSCWSSLFFLAVLPLIALIVVLLQRLGLLEGTSFTIAQVSLLLLSLPLVDSASQLATVLVAIFPIVVSAVCFKFSIEGNTPVSIPEINNTGRLSVLILIAGALFAAICVTVFNVAADVVNTINQNAEQTNYAKGVIGGILGFQVFYLARLLGWEQPK